MTQHELEQKGVREETGTGVSYDLQPIDEQQEGAAFLYDPYDRMENDGGYDPLKQV